MEFQNEKNDNLNIKSYLPLFFLKIHFFKEIAPRCLIVNKKHCRKVNKKKHPELWFTSQHAGSSLCL